MVTIGNHVCICKLEKDRHRMYACMDMHNNIHTVYDSVNIMTHVNGFTHEHAPKPKRSCMHTLTCMQSRCNRRCIQHHSLCKNPATVKKTNVARAPASPGVQGL